MDFSALPMKIRAEIFLQITNFMHSPILRVYLLFTLFWRQTNLDYRANWREVKLFPPSAIGYLIDDIFHIDPLLFIIELSVYHIYYY